MGTVYRNPLIRLAINFVGNLPIAVKEYEYLFGSYRTRKTYPAKCFTVLLGRHNEFVTMFPIPAQFGKCVSREYG